MLTDIEKKALALVNEVETERGMSEWTDVCRSELTMGEALCRAIEQHEAYKQEVSDALEKRGFYIDDRDLGRFIIARPDPLVDAWLDAFPGNHIDDAREECAKISAALAARGLEVRKIGEGE